MRGVLSLESSLVSGFAGVPIIPRQNYRPTLRINLSCRSEYAKSPYREYFMAMSKETVLSPFESKGFRSERRQQLRPSTERWRRTPCLLAEGAFAASGPPVQVTHNAHGRRHQQDPDDRRVHENGHGEAQADRFGNNDAAKDKRTGHDDDN